MTLTRRIGLLGLGAAVLLVTSGCRVEYHHEHGRWRHGPGHDHGHRPPPPPPPRRCHGRHCHWAVGSEIIEVSESTAALARQYQIKVTTAEAVEWLASGEAKEEDLQLFGLKAEDVKSLASLTMPSTESIDRMADAFGENRESVERLVRGFIADIQAENQPSGN